MERQKFLERFAKETIYLENVFDEVVFKCEPGGVREQKRKGENPTKVKDGSKLFTEALIEPKEITKEEYLNY